ncbi:MAG TPA: 1,4-dihydroxy-2-naphthoate polyprenyltransferase [Opitutaceae bacterium]
MTPPATPSPPWRTWVSAARPRTLPAAVAPVIVGSALAGREHRFDPAAAGLCLVFALLVQIGTNFANDYYDFVHGADGTARVGPRRAVASGLVAPAAMKRAMGAVFLAAFLSGLGLIHWGGPWMLAIGVASIVCGIAYTGGPWPLGYHGFGDLFVFVFFGLVAVTTTYFVQAGQVTAFSVLAGVPVGLLAANILLVNNYRDAQTDAAASKRTLVVQFGKPFARAQFAASLGIALAVPVVFWAGGLRPWCLLPLFLAPLALSHVRRLRDAKSAAQLVALLGDTGQMAAAYAALFAAGILL